MFIRNLALRNATLKMFNGKTVNFSVPYRLIGKVHREQLATEKTVKITISDILHEQKCNNLDWSLVKKKVAEKLDFLKASSLNFIMLNQLGKENRLDQGLSLCEYIVARPEELNLVTARGMFDLYGALGAQRPFSEAEKAFLAGLLSGLREKHTMLDPGTNAAAIAAFAHTGDWRLCLAMLNEIKIVEVPSSAAFASTIQALFSDGQVDAGWQLIHEMIAQHKSLQSQIYKSWLDYCIRGSSPAEKLTQIERMFSFLKENEIKIDSSTANDIHRIFKDNLGWDVCPTHVSFRGECPSCGERLKNDPLTQAEFNELKSSIMDTVIIGKNVYMKASPQEVVRFEEFLVKAPPYDMVIDVLNVVMATIKFDKTGQHVAYMLRHLVEQGRNILILGRKHIRSCNEFRNWNSMASIFLTENLSDDDPFMLYATMMGGPNVDFVSRDLLRSHSFRLRNHISRRLFLRWQRQHQHIFLYVDKEKLVMRNPINYVPFPQKSEGWHVPYELERPTPQQHPSANIDAAKHWLCMHPPKTTEKLTNDKFSDILFKHESKIKR